MNNVGDHGYIGIHIKGSFAHIEGYDEKALLDQCFYPQNDFIIKIVSNRSPTIKAVIVDFPQRYCYKKPNELM